MRSKMRSEDEIIKKILECEEMETKTLNRLHGVNGQAGLTSALAISIESRTLMVLDIQMRALKWVLDKSRLEY